MLNDLIQSIDKNMTHKVFISYASENELDARAVLEILEKKGISCWIASEDIMKGSFADAIDDAISKAEILVLIFSAHANQSEHVHREIHLASERGKTIIPFRIEDVNPTGDLAYYIGNLHRTDAITGNKDDRINELANNILSKSRIQPDSSRHGDHANKYIKKIHSRLKDKNFSVKRNISYKDYNFHSVATNSEYSGIITLWISSDLSFIFSVRSTIDYGDFLAYSESCMQYAYDKRTGSMRKYAVAASCIPVMIVNGLDAKTAASIENMQPLQYPTLISTTMKGGVLGISTVYDFKSNRLYFSQQTPFLKFPVWIWLRGLIKENLSD